MNSRFREWMKEWKIDEKNEWKEDRDGMKVKELKKNEWKNEKPIKLNEVLERKRFETKENEQK